MAKGGECGKNADTAKLSKLLEVDTNTDEADIKKANQKLAGAVKVIACGHEVPIGYENNCMYDGVGEEDKCDSTVVPSSTVASPSLVAETATATESDAEGLQALYAANQKLAGEVKLIACGYEVPIGYENNCLDDGVGEADKSDSTVVPSSMVAPPSLVAETATVTESDAEGLQALYATAYGGWISPPGATDEVVYLSPTGASSKTTVGHPGAPQAAWVEATLELADQHGALFGLTAFNPLGQDTPHVENLAQDKLLEEDLMKLCAKTGGSWWRAFGFSDGWHEMGFTVAAPQDEMVELAKKYGQAAVYRFSRNRTPGLDAPFLRAVVPALILDTESEVPVSPVARPALDRADPFWQPSDREASDSDF